MSRRFRPDPDLETVHAAIVRHTRDGLAEQGDLDATGLAVHLAAEFERLIRDDLAAKVRALPRDRGDERWDTVDRAAVLALIEDPA